MATETVQFSSRPQVLWALQEGWGSETLLLTSQLCDLEWMTYPL
jgi:hypothetical protein